MKITNAAAVHSSPSTTTAAIAPALGTAWGGSSAAAGATSTAATARPPGPPRPPRQRQQQRGRKRHPGPSERSWRYATAHRDPNQQIRDSPDQGDRRERDPRFASHLIESDTRAPANSSHGRQVST